MDILIIFGIFCGLLVLLAYILLFALLRSNERITETNKQLMILVAGKETKSDALRALVASAKPPQGKLEGIAPRKKKEEKSSNTDFAMKVGVH